MKPNVFLLLGIKCICIGTICRATLCWVHIFIHLVKHIPIMEKFSFWCFGVAIFRFLFPKSEKKIKDTFKHFLIKCISIQHKENILLKKFICTHFWVLLCQSSAAKRNSCFYTWILIVQHVHVKCLFLYCVSAFATAAYYNAKLLRE